MIDNRLIFMIPVARCQWNAFELAELNDLDELPESMKTIMRLCKRTDKVYLLDNFILDFNLTDSTTSNKKYCMFVPDSKFDLSFLNKIHNG